MKKLYDLNLDFSGYLRASNAKLHWYPASFIPHIPNLILSHLSEPGQSVLDPFCGSGVTIQEATKLGLRSIGMDYNPIAALINKVITTYYNIDKLQQYYLHELSPILEKSRIELVPEFPDRQHWYHPRTLKELGRIKYQIENITPDSRKVFFELAFSAILKHCSTQKDHYTYVADNMFPADITENHYVSAFDFFNKRVQSNINIMQDYYEGIARAGYDPKTMIEQSHFIHQDANKPWTKIKEKIDIILTSPPYAGVIDYNKGQRLSYYWFPQWDISSFMLHEIGARYKRKRRNFFDEYLVDINNFYRNSKEALKKGGFLVVVIGQTSSIKRKCDLIANVRQLAEQAGLSVVVDDLKRRISFKQIGIIEGVKSESILIYQNK